MRDMVSSSSKARRHGDGPAKFVGCAAALVLEVCIHSAVASPVSAWVSVCAMIQIEIVMFGCQCHVFVFQ